MILFRSLKKISQIAMEYNFSIKKSIEQQSYFQHRKQTLPDYKYQQFKPTITIKQFVGKYQSKIEEETVESVSGRVNAIRKHGKTVFIDVREQHLKLQIAFKNDGKEIEIKRGDIVGVTGTPFVTKKGELSILPTSEKQLRIVSPCMWMLPQYGALKDQETRYRNRHIDLISNEHTMKVLKLRSKAISLLRRELEERGFLEVETPILSASCGGALAKPFITYHNEHKMNLFMRIAPELYLKQLLVGGFQKVFEIGKNFRNESIDQTHNPEFTTCELYSAYKNYKDMIKLTQQLFVSITRKLQNKEQAVLQIKGKLINLEGEWNCIDFIGGLQDKIGITFPTDLESEESNIFFSNLCRERGVDCEQPRSTPRLLDKLAGHFLEVLSYNSPLVIMNQPRILSPLAKPLTDRPQLTERFQLFINGWEFVNSYTELNNPRIQQKNTPDDHQFVEALEYGLVPCAGWGLGIDRFVMLLAGCQRIQQVIAFPLLKQEHVKE